MLIAFLNSCLDIKQNKQDKQRLKNTDYFSLASQHLACVDADWASLIEQVGPCTLMVKTDSEPYQALMCAVAYQQLHSKAGDAILRKFMQLFGDADAPFPSPQQVLAIEFDALRACGFSARKIATLKAIAEGAVSGLVPTGVEASNLSDEALISRLIQLKGIGQWTVEMLLIFNLARMDVLPVTDFAIVAGYKRLKKLAQVPKPKEMHEIGLAWRPYRTIASWYLWRVPKD